MAPASTIAEIAGHDEALAAGHLDELASASLATFIERRGFWQITADGKAEHPRRLAADVAGADLDALSSPYERFKQLNTDFKDLCGRWQLRNGELNDHADAAYDAAVIDDLVSLDRAAQPVVAILAGVLGRLHPYSARLRDRCDRLAGGETRMFAGVMCGSYHDVWMELHEDLILTQGISRAAEGSF